MPRIDLDILNQKQTPAFYASSLATRPAAGFVGRIFIDSDNPSTGLYRDTGTAWVQIADPGAGTTGTLQQVTTNGSTTNTGISVTANGVGIGTTAPGANILDVHGTTGVLAQLENTTTQNSLLSFRNQGAGVWSVGNGYNAGANDFIIYDAVSFVNRLTIKATGQTFIGADTTSSGLFVVNSATSDNHIVILGANAPSIRLRNAGTSPTLNVGLGISTAANNFIQGSVSGNFCIFNSSTTASPILFGVYDAGTGNTQEAVRISAARNFLIGQVIDNGEKLQIGGNIFNTSAGSTNGQRITLQNTTVNEIQYAFVNGGSSINNIGRLAIRNGNNGTNLLQIGSNGTAFLQEINAGVSAALNTITAVNGSGGGNRQFDLSFTGTTTGFIGEDNGDEGYGYFQISIVSGKVYQIQTTILTTNGSPKTVITSTSTNFVTGTVQTVEASPIDGTRYYQFTAIGTAAYIGIGFTRTSGTMTATVTNFSITQLNNVLVTNAGKVLIGTDTIGGSIFRIVGLPTSSVGLSSGDVYSNLGILTIVP